MIRIVICFFGLCCVGGCASNRHIDVDSGEQIIFEQTQLPESHLLDVGILLFETDEINEQQQEEGITEPIRQAESRYMSYHLRETMQKAGSWGSVFVLPAESEIADVRVVGKIIESSGKVLVLKITVIDSTGKQWFEKNYRSEVVRDDYSDIDGERKEVFQAVYNQIANDLYHYRRQLDEVALTQIRNTSEMLYAARLAPAVYAPYVSRDEAGNVSVLRLPAAEDPSIIRVREIREREYLLVNTINEHYGNYYDRVSDSYLNWRRYYLLETEQRRQVEKEARLKKTVGAVAVIGSILMSVFGEGGSPALVVGGVMLYQDGANAAEEANIHREAVVELSESLQADVEPLVVELDGQALALSGTLDQQYQQWRVLLQQLYVKEVGLPLEAASPISDYKEGL